FSKREKCATLSAPSARRKQRPLKPLALPPRKPLGKSNCDSKRSRARPSCSVSARRKSGSSTSASSSETPATPRARSERRRRNRPPNATAELARSPLISTHDSGQLTRNQVLREAERGEDVEPASPGRRRSRGGRDEPGSASSATICRIG